MSSDSVGPILIRTKSGSLLGYPSQLFDEWRITLLSLSWFLVYSVLTPKGSW